MKRALWLALLLTSCVSGQNGSYPNFTSIELREYGIILHHPALWDLNFDSKRKLPLVARGFTHDGRRASIEYRGIPQTQEDVDLYAEGWYKAMPSNFDSFEMVDRKKISTEQGIVYHFEGTFREGDQRQRVVGRLRIRDGRVHAIYYLADDKDFSSFREILEDLDQSHRYFRP